jgi:hypothetical protein
MHQPLHLSLALPASVALVLTATPIVAAQPAGDPAARPPAVQQAGPPQPATADAQSISGAWTLDLQSSDREPAIAPGGGEPGEGERGGGRRAGMGGGRMGGGMRGEGRGSREAMQQARETVQELVQPAERLTITQTPDQVTFTDSDGRIRHYAANGRKEKHQMLSGVVETKTTWKDGQLVMESQPEGGGAKVVQTYSLDPKTRQLIVTTAMEGSGRSMPPIRRVYDNVMDVR